MRFRFQERALCGERRFVEFHHVIPHAASGPATVENIQLRCRAHNGHEVDLFFGPGKRRTREDVVGEARAVYSRGLGSADSFQDEYSFMNEMTVDGARADVDREGKI
jgi:hypothetical protein